MDLGVKGRNYVLVGASRGIGWETARLLAEDGANIAIVSRNPAAVSAGADALAERCGVEVVTIEGDVTRPGSAERAIEMAVAALGNVRGLAVSNFSASHSPPLTEMAEADWDFFYQDTLMGTVRCCKAIIPHLIERGGGQIVVTSAYSARAAKSHLFGYAAFKAALLNFTKNIAKTYGRQGIRANCVCPGAIETERSRARLDALMENSIGDRREAERRLLSGTMKMTVALERLGQAFEVGEMMAFLLSERAAYTTGLIANVDGGTDF